MNFRPFFILLIVFTGIVSACKKTPNACYDVKDLAEVNEPITFQNCSIDAHSYFWHFDDGTESEEASPVKSYSKRGKYQVYLTAFNKNKGRHTRYNSIIEIGNRFLEKFSVNSISFTKSDGSPWDADNSGPDIKLYYGELDDPASKRTTQEVVDVQPSDIPLVFLQPNDLILTDTLWLFTLVDQDAGSQDTMQQWIMNPGELSVNNPFNLQSIVGGNWDIEVVYKIR